MGSNREGFKEYCAYCGKHNSFCGHGEARSEQLAAGQLIATQQQNNLLSILIERLSTLEKAVFGKERKENEQQSRSTES